MPDHDDRPPWAGAPAQPYAGWTGYGEQPGHPAPLTPYGPYGPPAPTSPAPVDVRVVGAATGTRGLALAGVVLGGAALLGVLLLGVLGLVTSLDPGGSGSWGPTRGTVAPSSGSSLDGASLAAEIERRITDEGGAPEGITCPSTPKVAQDVTTVCHGDVDGDEWAFVVFFEDTEGRYTLLEV